jgi:SAM-dependent methyltransferase
MSNKCPVCRSESTVILEACSIADLCVLYAKQIKIDVCKEFPPGLKEEELRQCQKCGMQFFSPLVTGSAEFYSQLAGQDVYYSKTRWEFERAKELLREANSVLDIGCGDGFFLSTLDGKNKQGLEFNPLAVAKAQAKGLNVQRVPLKQIPKESFQAATLFHVLEHVSTPIDLLQDAINVLQRDGLLIISVPNNDSFIGEDLQHPANAPPHHPLRWVQSALRYLPNLLPIKLQSIEIEPLSREHLFIHRKVLVLRQLQRLGFSFPLLQLTPKTVLINKFGNALAMASMKLSQDLPSGKPGFSILAVYRKI